MRMPYLVSVYMSRVATNRRPDCTRLLIRTFSPFLMSTGEIGGNKLHNSVTGSELSSHIFAGEQKNTLSIF